ncbi:MAG: YciI family protein [Archangiaceae bacterium]|nr:YciI family protein [Archangiaceae bacterium]
MKYLVLIFQDERLGAETAAKEPQAFKAMVQEFVDYGAALKAANVLVGSNALQPSSTATTVRIRNGKTTHTDGPFAETKEQLGGYYLLDVPNLDEALKWAAKCPGAKWGSIEVRPVAGN